MSPSGKGTCREFPKKQSPHWVITYKFPFTPKPSPINTNPPRLSQTLSRSLSLVAASLLLRKTLSIDRRERERNNQPCWFTRTFSPVIEFPQKSSSILYFLLYFLFFLVRAISMLLNYRVKSLDLHFFLLAIDRSLDWMFWFGGLSIRFCKIWSQ